MIYHNPETQCTSITALEQLFQKYRIDLREKRATKTLTPQDLKVVAYKFLSKEDFKDLTHET